MAASQTMEATQQQMQNAKIDLAYRDFCAHLLIPLNACRRNEYFLPWKCEHERHVYEKCQYKQCVTPHPTSPNPCVFFPASSRFRDRSTRVVSPLGY